MSGEAFGASPQQEAQWVAEPDGPSGRVRALLVVEGAVDGGALRAAVERVSERQEILRTSFARRPGISVPLQVVHDALEVDFATVDAPNASSPAAHLDALTAAGPADLEERPHVRFRHVELGPAHHLLAVDGSGLCLDLASVPALAAELAAQLGAAADVPEEPFQYADFAEWQRELAAGEDAAAATAREHWAALEVPPTPPLLLPAPADNVPPAAAPVAVDAAAVGSLAASYDATPEDVLHAAWCALLARLSSAAEIVTTLHDAGPDRDGLDGLIGPSARAVPVPVSVDADRSFVELLAAVARARSAAAEAEEQAPIVTAPAGPGVATVGGFAAGDGSVRVRLDAVSADLGPGPWLVCHDLAGTARVHLQHALGRDADSLVERMAGQLGRLVAAAAGAPDTAVGRLPVLGDAEREEVVERFNATAAAGEPEAAWTRFARHAERAPDAVAVRDSETTLTYAELSAHAAALTAHLQAAGHGPGDVIGLCADRSAAMAVGLLGILGAGAAFLPLHFEHPPARLAAQLADAGSRAVVCQRALADRLPADAGAVVLLEDVPDGGAPAPVTSRPEDPAYVVFTSGSTGRPKGVVVTNRNLANYVDHLVRFLDAEAEPLSFGVVTALSTDLGHTSVFGALCSGGALTLIAPAEAADGPAMARRLDRTPVDVLKITPSHLAALLAGDDAAVLPRRWLIAGGERLGWDLVERVRWLGACTVVNHYGPSETTVGSCMAVVPDGPGPLAPSSVPIGRPIANTRCYVLDAGHEPVPVGAPGNLFIAGAGVAAGYAGRPDLTAERFLADPFADGVMYDTGDRARWLPDGTLEYLGRADEQVKIRGFRVEPGEVEEALRAHAAVREAAVVVREDAAGAPRLVAYAVHGEGVSADDLVDHLAGLVPDYMVPAALVALDALPRTPSGKVDRQSLPEPVQDAGGDAYVAPRTPIEEAIAAIWAAVLGVERVGAEDDFFALGGHSLLAAQVVAQVRSDFAVELPMHSLFTLPTVASLSEEIARMSLEDVSDEDLERMLAEGAPVDES